MMELAGRCGYSEEEFWAMTPRFFYNATKGWEANRREAWERSRYAGYLAILPHVDKKKKLKITDLGRFPWEDEHNEGEALEKRLAGKKTMLLERLKQAQAEAANKKKAEEDERSKT